MHSGYQVCLFCFFYVAKQFFSTAFTIFTVCYIFLYIFLFYHYCKFKVYCIFLQTKNIY